MQSSPHLADHIRNALIRPFHKGVPRIEARKYILGYLNLFTRLLFTF
jgi:hypothetical protein